MNELQTKSFAAAAGLSLRNLRNIRRLPSAFMPALLMPIFQTVAFSGTFFAITQVPGFPTDRSINWYMPLGVVMGSSFAGVGIGFSTVRDLESGFYDRIRMSPAPRRALLLGPLLSALTRAVMVVALVTIISFGLGARTTGGPLALVTLLAAGAGMSVIGTGWGLGLAYRFRDMRAAAIMQLSLFLALFLTTAQAPIIIMEGWLKSVARVNPFTQILQLARAGFVDEMAWQHIWGGVIAIVVIGTLAIAFAWTGLRKLQD
jgi:ABC-2 type transport system permease protein